LGIKISEFKKMNFNMVFSHDQIVAMVGEERKTQLIQVKILGSGGLTHWQLGIDAREHVVEKMAMVCNWASWPGGAISAAQR
jgi:hypothetical protein